MPNLKLMHLKKGVPKRANGKWPCRGLKNKGLQRQQKEFQT